MKFRPSLTETFPDFIHSDVIELKIDEIRVENKRGISCIVVLKFMVAEDLSPKTKHARR
jgi:hypothetical protein